jgi:hypothetical protein
MMAQKRSHHTEGFIALVHGSVFHHLASLPKCLVVMCQSQIVVLRREEPVLLHKYEVL